MKRIKKITDKPVFMIGHPRSGTTFLHRFILDSSDEFAGMKLEDMISPVLRSLLPLLRRISLDWLYDPDIHKTSLQDWEADDIGLGFKCQAGYLSYLYFKCRKGAVSDEDFYSWLDKRRERAFSHLLKMHLKKREKNPGKRFISKSFINLFFLDELISSYKDGKFVLLIRNPLETIPSTLSLMEKVQTRLFGFKKRDNFERQQYFDNVYNSIKCYYTKLDQVIKEKVDADNFMLISYKKLNDNFAEEFQKIISFYDIKIDDTLKSKLEVQDVKQKERQSKHVYCSDNYGIDEDKIRKDFAFIMENYEI